MTHLAGNHFYLKKSVCTFHCFLGQTHLSKKDEKHFSKLELLIKTFSILKCDEEMTN